MSDDVRISTTLRNHRKTNRLRKRLGGDGCWALMCLFLFAGEQRWTGDLSGMTDEDIEDEAGWTGEPGALIAALLEVRFLAGDEGHRAIHDWQEHNPYAASKGARIEKGRKAADARWGKVNASPGNATSMPEACSEHAASTTEQCPPAPAPAPAPAPSLVSDTSPHPAPSAGVGQFEGHAEPQVTPNPVAAFAIELNRKGFNVTTLNPDLIAYVNEGGSVEHVSQVAKLPECKGKKVGYVLSIARREVTERARPIEPGATHEPSRKLSASEQTRAAINSRRGSVSANA